LRPPGARRPAGSGRAFRDGKSQAQTLGGGRVRIGRQGVHSGAGAGLLEGLLESWGMEPSVNGTPVQARGGSGRSDGGALGQCQNDSRLAESKRR
jgi:hypothetical protein